MTRRFPTLLLLALLTAACDVRVNLGDGGPSGGGAPDSGTGGAGGGGGGNASGGGGAVAPITPCNAAMPCPSGQFCFNGLCALGCNSSQDCAADQYCDTMGDRLCHDRVVHTCSGPDDCASTQTCLAGFCSTPPPATQCDPEQVANGADGCARTAVCIDPADTQAEDPQCFSMPACDANKQCPTGLYGAVCNDGLIPNKALICLINLCRTVEHCPSAWACVKFTATDVLGVCSSRGFGSPCVQAADCLSGRCAQTFPGLPGFCQ